MLTEGHKHSTRGHVLISLGQWLPRYRMLWNVLQMSFQKFLNYMLAPLFYFCFQNIMCLLKDKGICTAADAITVYMN